MMMMINITNLDHIVRCRLNSKIGRRPWQSHKTSLNVVADGYNKNEDDDDDDDGDDDDDDEDEDDDDQRAVGDN